MSEQIQKSKTGENQVIRYTRGGGLSNTVKTYHLIGEHEYGFEGKFALAVVEKVFKTGAKQVNHHDVVVALYAKPVDVWDANYLSKKRQN